MQEKQAILLRLERQKYFRKNMGQSIQEWTK